MAGGSAFDRRLRSIRGLILCVVVLTALSVAAPRALAAGTLTDLGSLQPGCGSTAAAINNRGQIAGTSCDEPFRWTAAQGMRGLGFLSSANPYGSAQAINAKGEVTGWSADQAGEGFPNAFLWTPSKGMRNLDAADFYPGSQGEAINSAGQVAYTQMSPDGENSALLWVPGTGTEPATTLPTPSSIGSGPSFGSTPCCTAALDSRGDVTGAAYVYLGPDQGQWDAYLATRAGATQSLGALPGGTSSVGIAVNTRQDVAGDSENGDNQQEAFVWTPSGGMQGLIPAGATSSEATDINGRGEVVGYAQLAGGAKQAFLWVPGHGLIGLGSGEAVAINANGTVAVAGANGNAYRWTPSTGLSMIAAGTPTAINDHGQITGNGANGDGFLWSPGSLQSRQSQ